MYNKKFGEGFLFDDLGKFNLKSVDLIYTLRTQYTRVSPPPPPHQVALTCVSHFYECEGDNVYE